MEREKYLEAKRDLLAQRVQTAGGGTKAKAPVLVDSPEKSGMRGDSNMNILESPPDMDLRLSNQGAKKDNKV